MLRQKVRCSEINIYIYEDSAGLCDLKERCCSAGGVRLEILPFTSALHPSWRRKQKSVISEFWSIASTDSGVFGVFCDILSRFVGVRWLCYRRAGNFWNC